MNTFKINSLLIIILTFSPMLYSQNWDQLGVDIDGVDIGDWSGHSVSLSADGHTVAIGEPYRYAIAGNVKVLEFDGTSWIQMGNDILGEYFGDKSGYAVSLSDDGSRVAIGARNNYGNGDNAGHVRVYEFNGTSWIQLGNDIDGEAAGDHFGFSVSLSADGSKVAIGSPYNNANTGHVRVYGYTGASWVQGGDDIDGAAFDDFAGWSVSLSGDGSTVAIGAPNDGIGTEAGLVRVYKYASVGGFWQWVKRGADINGEDSGDYFGRSVSLSDDGVIVAIGGQNNDGNGADAGHVRVYKYKSVAGFWFWVQQGDDIDGEAAGDESGNSVSLSADGLTVAIGAFFNVYGTGQTRVYGFNGTTWGQYGNDIDGEAQGDLSGYSVSLSSDGARVAIGAPYNIDKTGHVRVYLSGSVGAAENNFENKINIYPNPTQGGISVELGEVYSSVSLTVRDMLGRTIQSEEFTNTDKAEVQINAGTGIYFIEVAVGSSRKASFKIVKN